MGKGGDLLVPTLLGEQVERAQGKALRQAHQAAFQSLFETANPTWLPGVETVLGEVRRRGIRTALATSSGKDDLRFLEKRMSVSFAQMVDVVVFGLRAPADGGTTRVAAPRSPENRLPRVKGGVRAAEARAAFERWLASGQVSEAQRPYAEQLLRETAG